MLREHFPGLPPSELREIAEVNKNIASVLKKLVNDEDHIPGEFHSVGERRIYTLLTWPESRPATDSEKQPLKIEFGAGSDLGEVQLHETRGILFGSGYSHLGAAIEFLSASGNGTWHSLPMDDEDIKLEAKNALSGNQLVLGKSLVGASFRYTILGESIVVPTYMHEGSKLGEGGIKGFDLLRRKNITLIPAGRRRYPDPNRWNID